MARIGILPEPKTIAFGGVAIGMALAFQLSVRLGLCPKDDSDRLARHLKEMGLPSSISAIAAGASAVESGTSLFVASMEVIPRELELEDYNVFLKLAALLAGFAAMSLLAIWA